MTTFIDEIIENLLAQAIDVSTITVILPSKRAGAFFRKTLSNKLSGKTLFLPQILSIEDLISEISGLNPATQTQLQLELYHTYLNTNTTGDKDSFLEFLGWAQTLLGDLNEIDRHLIPTNDFFNYLTAIKELDHWSTLSSESEIVSNYLTFWKSISPYYLNFKKSLEDKGLGYQGMIYRKAAELAKDYATRQKNKFVFAGFNALNTAEQEIIQTFLNQEKAFVYWDLDKYFLEDEKHAVSRFIREYKITWDYYKINEFPIGFDNFNTHKQIKSVAISQNIGQVKYVGQLLEKMSQNELNETAIILGDEALLLPLLNSLPPNITHLNVTMGLPLSQVPDSSFFENWFTLQSNLKENRFFYKDLLAFLAQPNTQLLLGEANTDIKEHIKIKNLVYVEYTDILKICEKKNVIASYLFEPWKNNPLIALDKTLKIISRLKDLLLPTKNWLKLEYLYSFLEIFNQLKNLCEDYTYIDNIKTLKQFYKELLSQETIDFRGDPYTGLQIMGVLESRVLDFKNVIITSLNEGVLPSGKSQNSFIPFDLKMEYKLPTYREKDAVYAYHFFRLLQRASNVHLLYNNQADGLNSGEKSRFLLQLETDKNAKYNYEETSASAPVLLHRTHFKEIQKNNSIINELENLAQYGFSPSALTTYIRNPLDFYYRYVLKIKEMEDVEDIIAHNTLGTIVHNTLEILYKPYLNTILSTAIVKKILSKVDEEVERQFEKEYNLTNIKTGKNLIIFHVAKQFVNNFLNAESKQVEAGKAIVIKGLECEFNVPLNLNGKTIKLKGTVDRLDTVDRITRVVDYKTGRVEPGELKINDWDLLTSDYKKHSKAFQVLCYALMLSKEQGLPDQTEAGIISFKNLGMGFMKFQEDKNSMITQEILEKFEIYLLDLITEILDINKPFTEKEV
tara:strand:- start:76 stop:2790 length:2715 start_codon:yes stop_codon:yes gene_type:complete